MYTQAPAIEKNSREQPVLHHIVPSKFDVMVQSVPVPVRPLMVFSNDERRTGKRKGAGQVIVTAKTWRSEVEKVGISGTRQRIWSIRVMVLIVESWDATYSHGAGCT